MLVGGIDIGSNTIRCLVGKFHRGELEEIKNERRITRLGEGVGRNGFLTPSGMDRTLGGLKEFCKVMQRFSVEEVAVVGTSALRIAKNRDVFLKQVLQETGWNVEVISGEEEAKRTFGGILFGSCVEGTFLVLDIGGGSTEMILSKRKKIDRLISIPIGVVSLTEKFLKADPTSAYEVRELQAEIGSSFKKVGFLKEIDSTVSLMGTAGTMTTLGTMIQGLREYKREKIHNCLIHKTRVEGILNDLLGKTLSERRKLPGLEKGREDLIVAGILILLGVMELLSLSKAKICDYGLLEGIVIHRAQRIGLLNTTIFE